MATEEKETLALPGPQVLITEALQKLHHPGRDIWHPAHTADLIKEACDTSTSARFEQREFLTCGTSASTFHHAPSAPLTTDSSGKLSEDHRAQSLFEGCQGAGGRLGRLTGR